MTEEHKLSIVCECTFLATELKDEFDRFWVFFEDLSLLTRD